MSARARGSNLPSSGYPSLFRYPARVSAERPHTRPTVSPRPEDSVLLHGPARDSTDRWFLRALNRLSRDKEVLVWVIAQAPALSRSRAASLPFPGKVHIVDMVSPVVGLGPGDPGVRTCNGPTDYQQLTLHLEDLVVPGQKCLVVVDNLNGICYSDQGERVLRAMNSINNLVSLRGGARWPTSSTRGASPSPRRRRSGAWSTGG
ncbi:MAG: hypothetical protein QXO51_00730 [Halobacteria archaeon]